MPPGCRHCLFRMGRSFAEQGCWVSAGMRAVSGGGQVPVAGLLNLFDSLNQIISENFCDIIQNQIGHF